MARFRLWNGPMPTTSELTKVTTGTALKTMLQFKASSTKIAKVLEWGISFDGSTAATPGSVELVETDVAATVTAYVANDIIKSDAAALLCGNPTTNLIQIGTSASGYTATVEGSITATRLLDGLLMPPTGPLVKQFPLGTEPTIQVDKFLRIRVKFGTAVNAICYVDLEI